MFLQLSRHHKATPATPDRPKSVCRICSQSDACSHPGLLSICFCLGMQRCEWPWWQKGADFHPGWHRCGCLQLSEAVPGSWRWHTPPSNCAEPQIAGPTSSRGPSSSAGWVISDSSRLSGEPGDSRLQSAHTAPDGRHYGSIQVVWLWGCPASDF